MKANASQSGLLKQRLEHTPAENVVLKLPAGFIDKYPFWHFAFESEDCSNEFRHASMFQPQGSRNLLFGFTSYPQLLSLGANREEQDLPAPLQFLQALGELLRHVDS